MTLEVAFRLLRSYNIYKDEGKIYMTMENFIMPVYDENAYYG